MADKPLLINYTQLNNLWMKWLTEPDYTKFDRWLKREAADWRKRLKETMPLELSQAMQHAMRFGQLACALELIQASGLDQDWETWADNWLPRDAEDIGRNNFWYWVQRRSHARWYIPNDWQAGSRQTTVDTTEEYVRNNPDSPLALIWFGISPELLPLINERAELSQWGANAKQTFIRLQQSRPPLWLRLRSDQDIKSMVGELGGAGVQVAKNEHGLCATGGFGISQTAAYKEGRIEIQDYASQQIAATVNAKAGEKIWDACAGGGGKALAMSNVMNSKGVVVATDLHDYKLVELKKRAKRAGHLNIRTFTWDGEAPLRLPQEIARQKGFDKVLVDAPCSATGTWRRNPDARLRLNEEHLSELLTIQQQLLKHASEGVRTGGQLIYATCSWLAAENEHAVEKFLAEHPEFVLDRAKMLGAPEVDSDTMFVAVMVKQA